MLINGSMVNGAYAITLNDAIEDYFRIVEDLKGFSKATISSYNSDFNQFINFLDKHNISVSHFAVITPAIIENFCLELLTGRRLSINTVHRKKDSLSSLFKHFVKRGWMESNPVEKIQIACKKKKVRKVFLQEEELRLFILADVSVKGYSSKTLRAAKLTLAFTGMRNQEIRKLRWENIDFNKNIIKVFDSKNTSKKNNPDNLDREIPICTTLKSALKEIQGDIGPVFNNISGVPITKDAVKSLVDRSAKITNINIELTPHGLRHNFASNLEKDGATLSDISFVLGHKPDSTTSGYIHSNLDRVAKLIEKFSSRVMEEIIENSEEKVEKNSSVLSLESKLDNQSEQPSLKRSDNLHVSCNKQEQSSILLSPKKIIEAQTIWQQFNGDKCMPADFLLGYVASSLNV